jgi:5-formyltetrahydrofolate cyclo-ligase
MMEGDDENAGSASPPCFMHELHPAHSGLVSSDPQAAVDVARWRKAERSRLIAERLAVPADIRSDASSRIAERLDQEVGDIGGRTVGIYWPFRGEPDLRGWGARAIGRGARLALPLVVGNGQPLQFRTWAPGEKLEKGVWNIPVPAGGETVLPDVVVAPLVGFDNAGYRLGYGGGFYDRTLAAMPKKPLTFGVGFVRKTADDFPAVARRALGYANRRNGDRSARQLILAIYSEKLRGASTLPPLLESQRDWEKRPCPSAFSVRRAET